MREKATWVCLKSTFTTKYTSKKCTLEWRQINRKFYSFTLEVSFLQTFCRALKKYAYAYTMQKCMQYR